MSALRRQTTRLSSKASVLIDRFDDRRRAPREPVLTAKKEALEMSYAVGGGEPEIDNAIAQMHLPWPTSVTQCSVPKPGSLSCVPGARSWPRDLFKISRVRPT